MCLDFPFTLKIRQAEVIIFDLLEVEHFNLASQCWKMPFKEFNKGYCQRCNINLAGVE